MDIIHNMTHLLAFQKINISSETKEIQKHVFVAKPAETLSWTFAFIKLVDRPGGRVMGSSLRCQSHLKPGTWLPLVLVILVSCTIQWSLQTLTCSNSTDPDIWLVGSGQCTDVGGRTAAYYACSGPDCLQLGDEEACAMLCRSVPSCTGFDLIDNPSQGVVCHLFSLAPPILADLNWSLVNGTQPSSGRTVVTSDSTPGACCYKRAYPRPNPWDNPIRRPPKQSALQKAIFANRSLDAAKASAVALPELVKLLEFCSANAVDEHGLPFYPFNITNCPGMGYATDNGTTSDWPTTAQLLERFSQEVCLLRND